MADKEYYDPKEQHTHVEHPINVTIVHEEGATWVDYALGASAILAGVLSILGIIKWVKSRRNRYVQTKEELEWAKQEQAKWKRRRGSSKK